MTKTIHIPRVAGRFFTAYVLRCLLTAGGAVAALGAFSSLGADPAAFEAFMEPLPANSRSQEQTEASEPAKGSSLEPLFLVSDFDSPFHIAYEIDSFDTSLEARLYSNMPEDLFLVEGMSPPQPDSEEIALVELPQKILNGNSLFREAKSMKNSSVQLKAMRSSLPASEGSIWLESLSTDK